MLARSAEPANQFTRRDAGRLILASVLLAAAMSLILGLDIPPAQTALEVGRPAPASIQAPRTEGYVSDILTERARDAARADVDPQYDFTIARGASVAAQQLRELERKVAPIDAAFGDGVTDELRATLLTDVLPGEIADRRPRDPQDADAGALDRGPRRGGARPRHGRALRAQGHRGVHDPRRDRRAGSRATSPAPRRRWVPR